MISCEDVLGKGSFDIYPEFYFALCLGEECNRRGMVLDMSSMVVEPDSLPNSLKSYFKYLLGVGALHLASTKRSSLVLTQVVMPFLLTSLYWSSTMAHNNSSYSTSHGKATNQFWHSAIPSSTVSLRSVK